jgi:hypothetical protein
MGVCLFVLFEKFLEALGRNIIFSIAGMERAR